MKFTIKMHGADINRLKYFRNGIAKLSNIKDGFCTAAFEVIGISKEKGYLILKINEDESYSLPESAYEYIKILSVRERIIKMGKTKKIKKSVKRLAKYCTERNCTSCMFQEFKYQTDNQRCPVLILRGAVYREGMTGDEIWRG